jgi:hypothetical protein
MTNSLFAGKEVKDYVLDPSLPTRAEKMDTSKEDLTALAEHMKKDDPGQVLLGMAALCDALSAKSLDIFAEVLVESTSPLETCIAFLVGSQPFKADVPNRPKVLEFLRSTHGENVRAALEGLD